MGKIIQPLRDLGNDVKKYVNLRIAYTGWQLGNRIADIVSSAITAILLMFVLTIVLLMLSFAFVFWYGAKIGTYYHGFLIMSLLYAFIGIIVYINRNKFYASSMVKKIESGLFSDIDPELLLTLNGIESKEEQQAFLRRKVEQGEEDIQRAYEELIDGLHPYKLVKNYVVSGFKTPTLTAAAIDLLLRWLRDKKKSVKTDDITDNSTDDINPA